MSIRLKRPLTIFLASATAAVSWGLPANATPWTFVTAAADDGLWYAGRVRRMGDQVIIHVKVTDDPDDGDYDYHQAMNCKTRQFRTSSGEWETINPKAIVDAFYEYGCKGVGQQATTSTPKPRPRLRGQLADTPFQF